ncbi:MAG: tRNA preQ1(34) S-adenosylmethionine ribosyltransferase-isomerase QueA [Halobacteriovoraceae bacterium]|nr:tRNA preQ1(34) S-adenosylmethionine ribosyltransferase-isomerase QueA [Halobacteriovoraceae bacterium]
MENPDLSIESYFYDLPTDFIAARPIPGRDGSKLMVYKAQSDEIVHTTFHQLSQYLKSTDLLVLNNTKVFPCRLFGNKLSGGSAELFLLSLQHQKGSYPALIKSSGKKKLGDKFQFGELKVEITDRTDAGEFWIKPNFGLIEFLEYLESHANVPIPPYIRDGVADDQDKKDYQTIYAKKLGSVAAPTAGLHFTEKVFESLAQKNIDRAFVNLEVGLGTFKPVQVDNILEHEMHRELFSIETEELKKINQADSLIAVGTTSLRVLESCYDQGEIKLPETPPPHSTNIFLYPGKNVQSIRGLITNFHLPKSTLLMLVSSLIGRKKTLELYEEAKKNNYRFFSYGDAMLILRDE